MSNLTDIKAEMADLQAKEAAYKQSHNEGAAGYNPYTNKVIECAGRLRQAELEEMLPKFPELRAAWNAEIARITTPRGVAMRDLKKLEEKLGVTAQTLRKLKAMHEAQ